MSDVTIELQVNGRSRRLAVPARLTLADLLRERLGLTGTHLGCEHGACGACTVLMDGRSVRSCITLAAQAQGREILTIEGASAEQLSALQQAFAAEGGLQCGFCTPGFVLAATELLAEDPAPDEERVRSALSGNLCRCTGYEGIVRAVLSQASDRPPPTRQWPEAGPPLGDRAEAAAPVRPRPAPPAPAPPTGTPASGDTTGATMPEGHGSPIGLRAVPWQGVLFGLTAVAAAAGTIRTLRRRRARHRLTE